MDKADKYKSSKKDIIEENRILKEEIQTAERLLKQQNSHLKQVNLFFVVVFSIMTIGGVLFGVVGYLQFYVPMKEQRTEIRELNNQSIDILNNLQEFIVNKIEEDRFRVGMKALNWGDLYAQIGIPIIQECVVRGLKQYQMEEIDEFIRNDLRLIQHDNHRKSVAIGLVYMLSLHSKTDEIDKLFEDLESGDLDLGVEVIWFETYFRKYQNLE